MDAPCPDAFIALAQRMVDASGEILRRHFRTAFATEDKPDKSPVTTADRETEEALRSMIETAFPEHGIIGEEFGETREDADYVWTLDPLDGTAAFITGKPLFGTLIGLLPEGVPVFGIIDHPITRERWMGGRGLAATCNDEKV
ncbi:MAG: inositol monophosphatase family protein, partial [Alphaproteobacteria bacterium]|nr:inositol monophosphatase family protein [Alphaproteobacteria bacterium]